MGVSTGLELLPVLPLLGTQIVNFRASTPIQYLFTSPHLQDVSHSAWFGEFTADPDRDGPCSDGPQNTAGETAKTLHQMVI